MVLAWNEKGHSDFDADSVVTVWTEKGNHHKIYKMYFWHSR